MSVGFTGTQRGISPRQKEVLNSLLKGTLPTFHHGDCIGADAAASTVAELLGCYIVCHPPINSSKRAYMPADETRPKKEYLDRNHDIVDETDELIAAPGEMLEQLRSGTWATIRYARKRGKPVTIIFPDGSIEIV